GRPIAQRAQPAAGDSARHHVEQLLGRPADVVEQDALVVVVRGAGRRLAVTVRHVVMPVVRETTTRTRRKVQVVEVGVPTAVGIFVTNAIGLPLKIDMTPPRLKFEAAKKKRSAFAL